MDRRRISEHKTQSTRHTGRENPSRFGRRTASANLAWCSWFAHLLPKLPASKRKSFALSTDAAFNGVWQLLGQTRRSVRPALVGNRADLRHEMVDAAAAPVQNTANPASYRGEDCRTGA